MITKKNKLCYSNPGDHMKTDIIYSNDMLLVNLEGNMLDEDYKKLKQKLDYIKNEYMINDIIFDIKSSDMKEEFLNDMNKTFNNVTIRK